VLFRKTFTRADDAESDVIIVSMYVDDGLSLYSNDQHYKDFIDDQDRRILLLHGVSCDTSLATRTRT